MAFAILGHMAYLQNSPVETVVTSGPGLVFLTYPAVMETLPGSVLWAAIFFIMLAVRLVYLNLISLYPEYNL